MSRVQTQIPSLDQKSEKQDEMKTKGKPLKRQCAEQQREEVHSIPKVSKNVTTEQKEDAVRSVPPSASSGSSAEALSSAAGASRPPLLDAAERGDQGAVRNLLRNGHDADTTDADGSTALLLAAAGGHVAAMEALLKGKADASIRGPGLRSPLHVAAHNGHLAAVRLLLKCNADVNAKDADDSRALHLAATGGHKRVVTALLKNMAEVNAQDANGIGALHFAAGKGHEDVVSTLLENGALVNEKDAKGNSPLHYAAEKGHTYIINALLQRHADINSCNDIGQTAMLLAAIATHWDIVVLLAKKKAMLTALDDGTSALLLACRHSQAQAVRFLLQCKVQEIEGKLNSGSSSKDTSSIAELLCVAGNGAVVNALANHQPELLKQRPGDIAVCCAARDGRLSALKALLAAGANPCAEDYNKKQALYLAATGNHADCCKELLNKVATETNKSMLSKTLSIAKSAKEEQVVTMLKKLGACDKFSK